MGRLHSLGEGPAGVLRSAGVPARDSSALFAVVALLAVAIIGCTVLVALDKLGGDVFVGVVVGPVIGGGIAFVAGTKGVQQGSQASTSPPPTA